MKTHKITITSNTKSESYYYEKKPNKYDKENAMRAFVAKFGRLRGVILEVKKVNLVKATPIG